MNTYEVTWTSEGNIEKGTVVVRADNLVETQDKFLDWLKKKPLYQHMWQLSFAVKEIDFFIPEVIE